MDIEKKLSKLHEKLLIKNTTKKERREIIESTLKMANIIGISESSAKEYIEGKKEIFELG